MSLRPLVFLIASPLLVVPACHLPNPDFDGPGGEATGPTSTSTTSTSAPPATQTTAATVEGDSETSVVPPMTESATDTSSTSDTNTSSTSDTDPGPVDCWGADPNVWTITQQADAELGADPISPRISPDGLTLYYTAMLPEPQLRWVHRATRLSRDVPFVSGEAIADWQDQDVGLDHPNMNTAEDELIYARRVDGMPADLWRMIREKGEWQPPQLITSSLNTLAYNEDFATITEDGSRLIVQRSDGPPNALLNATWTLYEAERAPNPEPGVEFGELTKVELAPITGMPGNVVICPVLSPDGHHLFFASTHPKVLQEDEPDEILKIFYTSRASLDDPWEPADELGTLSDDDPEYAFESCPNSVTRDGCQLYFNRFQFNKPDNIAPDRYRIFAAERTP